MDIWNRLDAVARDHDVLRHPFYLRWSEGKLSPPELSHYAGQYRHAVLALAAAADAAARSPEAGADAPALAEHAAEEAAHVTLWDEFTAAVGGDPEATPSAETRDCARAWADPTHSFAETLAAMYAIENAQPAISATKQQGLEHHYKIDATAYFEIHRERDLEHAAQMRQLITKRLADVDEDALVDSATGALQANWRLLDGVETVCAGM
ncbi:MAG TPA: iron-containing redox enzyme family protein [Candidatus Limnocylindria bacterium]|nr:iron-containing redox enzyme family protein [Candidatus Limnocylindria bacterium]